MTLDLRLYLVSGDRALDDESAAIVAAAIAGGVTIVQLRHKRAATSALVATADQVRESIGASGVPLIVNDDVEAARLTGAAGVHVGPDDMHPAQARSLLGPDAIIGWSIHTLAQLSDDRAMAACDYLAASPVWATATKPDTTAPFGLDGVRALRAAMPARLPLVGIGGIDATNAADVIQAGADGVAVVSAIWSAPDPAAAARALRTAVDGALAARGRK